MYITTVHLPSHRNNFSSAAHNLLLVFFFAVAALTTASAQNPKANSSDPAGALEIRIRIVSTVSTPAVQPNVSSNTITYNVITTQPSVDVIQTTTQLPRSSFEATTQSELIVLITLTIVPN